MSFCQWLVMTLVMCVGTTAACTCIPSHPQQQFCSSNFVLRVQVLSATGGIYDPLPVSDSVIQIGWTDVVYTVKVVDVFKGTNINVGSEVKIYTGSNSAACGVMMLQSPGDLTTWLISGSIIQGKKRIFSCGFNSNWDNLTFAQKEGVRVEYALACGKCTICSEFFCQEEGLNVCKYQISQTSCYSNAYCKPGINGCFWTDCVI